MTDDNASAVTVLIEIHAKDGAEQEARDALVHAIETSVKPGFLGSRVYADLTDPGAFYSVQQWESARAFHAHMAEAREGMAEATSMLSRPPRTTVLSHIA
ncbi:antibiotic biosynthesis monooxygenase [Streptomyces sp. NPDC026659]|uniref:putative quinol monooxygenase n=1 Tax=Streptomyces sp. NPDC026659 TaxID=3155123 RepID=UPI003403B95B